MRSELVEGALEMAVATPAGTWSGCSSTTTGRPIPRPRLPGTVREAQGDPVGAAHRIVPGQRRGRVVLGDDQARTRESLALRQPRRGPPGDHRLDQPLQPRWRHSTLGNVTPIEWELLSLASSSSRIAMCPVDGGEGRGPPDPVHCDWAKYSRTGKPAAARQR